MIVPKSCPNHAKTVLNGPKKKQALISKCLIYKEIVVEPGGIEPPSASPPQPVLHA